MNMQSVRPIVVSRSGQADVCEQCDVRHRGVCSAMADADLARLADVAVVRDYDKGKVFIEEGEPAHDFFNVTSGTAKLFKLLPDGRQQVTGFASVGYFLGLAVSERYAFSAQAIEPVRVCRFSRPKLRAVLDDFPALERRLLEMACNELVTAQEQMLMLGRKTAQEKVASFLVSWSQTSALCDHHVDTVRLPMTRGEIADHLGLTIETVSRTISKFRADKRISAPSPAEIHLLDRPWLEHTAGATA